MFVPFEVACGVSGSEIFRKNPRFKCKRLLEMGQSPAALNSLEN
jgi:hypothetical protein